MEPLPNGVLRSRSPTMSPLFQEHFSAEIVSLLEEGAIEELRDHLRLCLSPVFVIPKRSGSLRLFLFLKRFNLLLGKSLFRMDHLASILPSLNPVDVVFLWIFATPFFLYRSINDLGIFWGLPFWAKFTGTRHFPLGCAPLLEFSRESCRRSWRIYEDGVFVFSPFLDDWLLVA